MYVCMCTRACMYTYRYIFLLAMRVVSDFLSDRFCISQP